MAIKNIIFDMGGVLVEFNPENMIRRCSLSDHKDEIMTALFKSEEWKKMDSGDLSVDEALEIMTDRLAPQIREKAKVMVLDRENYMPPLKGTTPIINALHQNGYRLFVLSNCPAWFHSFKKSIPSIELFEGFVVSADCRVSKPDEKIYKIFLDKFSLKAEECFFIDDSQANTDKAKELGFFAHKFDISDTASLIKDMRECGVNI